MPTGVRWGQVVITAAVCSAAFGWTRTPASSPAEVKPVTVASLERQLPVGHLGVPLGTVVRVTGQGTDGDTPPRKKDAGKTLIRIVTVNGKRLAQPVVFEFGRVDASVHAPIPGEKFDYYVHEYGEFDGIVEPPKELGIRGSIGFDHDGFHYRPRLTVHASNGGSK